MSANDIEIRLKNIGMEYQNGVTALTNVSIDIKKDEHIGDVIDPVTGKTEEYVTAPCGGKIFTLREFPIVYGGSLIARILGGETDA